MADLQDELHSSSELDGLPDPFEAESYAQVSDPAGAPLERARAILAAHPVADGYSGLPWALRHLPWYDLELGESSVDTDVPRLREGHVGALFWSLHLPEGLVGDRAVGATLEQLDLVNTVVRTHPEGLRLACTAGQATDARNCGRIAVAARPRRSRRPRRLPRHPARPARPRPARPHPVRGVLGERGRAHPVRRGGACAR